MNARQRRLVRRGEERGRAAALAAYLPIAIAINDGSIIALPTWRDIHV